MTQHKFLDRRLQEYNAILTTALQNLATSLPTENCSHQSKLIKIMLEILSEVNLRNEQFVAAIEEDIKNSLLLD
ncbi:MAG: hypothetical protein KI793_12155 [Rivularia sp. (in: Bacteria)]|nr:hypothetical protein [Rivularia sp. MS3]